MDDPNQTTINFPFMGGDVQEGGTYTPPDSYNTTQVFGSFGNGNFGSNGGSNGSFWNALSTGLNDATKILGARYAVPQLANGQYIQSGPNGSVMYQGNPGSAPLLPSSLGIGSISPIVLIAGAAALFFVMKGH